MKEMENLIEKKEQALFLSLIIKKISKDRLNAKELKSYTELKYKVDPEGKLEMELVSEWKKAEAQSISERVQGYQNKESKKGMKAPKQFFINIIGKFLSFFI